jgi:signal transduction histidine kinase/DNA-binding response OmpR family regulator
MSLAIITVSLRYEEDVVVARQRSRQVAALLGFEAQDSARIATAVSEIARNAFRYAGGGDVEFAIEGERVPQVLVIRVKDRGRGIPNLEEILEGRYKSDTGMGLGIIGARRLMDLCEIDSAPGAGTTVQLKKILPRRAPLIDGPRLSRLAAELASKPASAIEEVQQQSRELMRALEELRQRQDELMKLNRELEDTNRGVVALYAELDEKADHLRRADAMKSRFLSNMSHEFRTPLNSIRAFTRLLVERADGPLTAEQETQIGYIRKSAEGLTELVDDLLDLAKIEAGKIEVRPIAFSMGNLFSALRGMLRPLLVSDQVSLVIEDPEGLPEFYTDEPKVSQILRNFISNAIKFTKAGEVRVSAELVDGGNRVLLRVADTGIGIAAADLDRVFEEFVQIPGPAQVGLKGTGLGLPLVKKLATLLGGWVTVQSEPGVGSIFTATLPVRYEGIEALEELPSLSAPVAPLKVPVLVVEDELETQMFYAKVLRNTPYQVAPARNLRQATDAVNRQRPAAIVLDILLRGEESWAWLGELKNATETARIPIIVATTEEDERKAAVLGADVYLRKPVDRAVLLEHLDRLTAARVLVIDDDEPLRHAIRKFLEPTRYCVVEAGGGGEGLRAARDLKPRAILLDLQLPDIQGEEVLRRLKSEPSTSGIPVVVMTSKVLSAAERNVLGQSAHAVMSKQDLSSQEIDAVLARVTAPAEAPA